MALNLKLIPAHPVPHPPSNFISLRYGIIYRIINII